FLAVLVSWKTQQRTRAYFALLLVVETAVAGVFSSWDLFLFFVFWELELAPMYLLIGIWGGERREYAAMKFILYTVGGSAFMLVKMRGYALLRVNFGLLPGPTRQFATLLAVLAVINIVYGALVAIRQSDLKRLIANSSISHMGYVVLGASAAVAGGAAGTMAL